MRAISQNELGGPEVLHEIQVDKPRPGPTEVLVKVHAAGVNPVDVKTRSTGGRLGRPPFVLGWDVSGVVEEVGVGVTLHQPGDEVFGMPLFPHEAGGYSEYVTAPSRHFARKPANIDHVHAAGLSLVGLTAWQSLVETANLQPGQRVLVHAAAGGVGHVAVQLAKALGAHVIGTARQAKHEFVLGLGADEVVDYTEVDFAEAVGDLDVVLDTVGGDYGIRSLPTLRPGGSLVSILPDTADALRDAAAGLDVTADVVLCEPDQHGLRAVADLVERGLLRVEIDTVLPLALAAKAHELSETGRAKGKIVLSVA